jgi:lipopolysaccharide/colanic/teichoic acid biosynthesis glycosyltransferase
MENRTDLVPQRNLLLEGERPSAAVTYSFYRRRGKRLLDIALAVPMFLSLLPIMAVIGLALLVTSGWPVLYWCERLGRDGRRFPMCKFRTMVRDSDKVLQSWKHSNPDRWGEYASNFKLQHDPRVTPFGRFLRKATLDELPQLWNVLRGEMSLVGPRPYLPTLAPSPAFERTILLVSPGMTGPWQVRGRNKLPPLTRMQLDVEYASDIRVMKDVMYLLASVKILISFNGV